jgi:cyanophycinase-like exopeptidase
MPADAMTPDHRQDATWEWCKTTVPGSVSRATRASRFLEEAVELAQAAGMSPAQAFTIVDYVFQRRPGEPSQEVGGVMITLSILATSLGISVDEAWCAEFDRIHQPEVIAKIRARQSEKKAAGL